MATTINTTTQWASDETQKSTETIWTKWLRYADSQAKYRTMWFLLSLMLQGVLFLPVPAVLLYYYDAPIFVLGVTLTLFFSNIIAGMGGASIRAMLTLFAASVAIHLLMLAIYIL